MTSCWCDVDSWILDSCKLNQSMSSIQTSQSMNTTYLRPPTTHEPLTEHVSVGPSARNSWHLSQESTSVASELPSQVEETLVVCPRWALYEEWLITVEQWVLSNVDSTSSSLEMSVIPFTLSVICSKLSRPVLESRLSPALSLTLSSIATYLTMRMRYILQFL